MTTISTSTQGSRSRLIQQPRSRVLTGLRVLPAALVLLGAVSFAPAAGATSCHGGLVAVNGGTVSNSTTIDLSADGGLALSTANGGDNNLALAGNNGVALAGNGGIADANANGGMIDLDNINSGNNRGNSIAVSGGAGCGSQTLVDGGNVRNETTIRLSADGGVAAATANGGDGNIALAGNNGAAAAGNGGVALANANGGAISVGDVNSGNNRGNVIQVQRNGTGWFGRGAVTRISGGNVRNSTLIEISADGGTALSSANGGDGNIAVAGQNGAAAAGNGGIANAQANGGAITVGDINSGNNRGNTIAVSGTGSGAVVVDGGNVTNETTIAISADGGTAVSSADGGNNNAAGAGTNGTASAGNGGIANAEANGGNVTIGDINSGNNQGNQIAVSGNSGGTTVVDGGNVSNTTTIDISADGGTAVATADGGDGNIAVSGNNGDAAAGNGGVANAEANGGTISLGDVNSGGNSGNTIMIGN
jgi:hypothetical protein